MNPDGKTGKDSFGRPAHQARPADTGRARDAAALPKFIDLSTEAKAAALQGVVGGAASAMAVNYAGCRAVNNVVTANKCVAITNCTDVANILQGGAPNGYVVTAGAIAAPPGTAATCTITQSNGGATATFIGIRTGP